MENDNEMNKFLFHFEILLLLLIGLGCSKDVIVLKEIFDVCDVFSGMALVMAMAIMLELMKSSQRKREANRRRNRQFALESMLDLSDDHFKRMFRMSKATFDALVDKMADLWDEVDVGQAARSSGSHICLRTRLALTLRWMAGGHLYVL